MKLTNFKFKSVDQISEGLSEIESLVSKLKNLKSEVSDQMQEGVILAALPSSFRTFVTVWKGTNPADRTITNLKNRILAEVEDNKILNKKEDKALLAAQIQSKGRFNKKFNRNQPQNQQNASNSKGQGNKKNNFRKGNCNYCKKPGHYVNECRKLQNKKETENKKKDDESKDKGEPKTDEPRHVTFMAALESPPSQWIADSGATCHMTSKYEWFRTSVNFVPAKPIFIGNGESIEALGVGSIVTTAGILNKVYHVPQIASNIFSIVAATKNGISAEYSQDRVNLYKNRKLVLSGTLENNVYILEMDVVLNEHDVAYVARTWRIGTKDLDMLLKNLFNQLPIIRLLMESKSNNQIVKI